jgi:uridine phosphorylase
MSQPHLKVDKVEEKVIIPGDPGRIDLIAKSMKNLKDFTMHRGLRVSQAEYLGEKMSLVATGMGCPSAAIVVEELANLGAKKVIRIGTCGGLLKEMQPGDLIIPDKAFCGDGTTREYNPNLKEVEADKKVVEALIKAAKKLGVRYFVGTNRTHDAFYEPLGNFTRLAGNGYISSEMECSAVFLVSKLRELKAGAILVVNTPEPPEEVEKNPDMIYQLVDEKKVSIGMDNAIKVALEAMKEL